MSSARLQASVRWRALRKLLRRPTNLLQSLLFAITLLFIFQWLFAIDLLIEVVKQSGFGSLFRFMVDGFIDLLQLSAGDYIPIALILVSLTQGLTLAVVRRAVVLSRKKTRTTQTMVLTLFGSGCVACGGSIIAPLFSGLSATAATSAAVRTSMVVLTLAVGLAVYSLWQALATLATIQAKEKS